MDLGLPEIILILVVVVLLFGPGRIGKVASELGTGIRNFRKGLEGSEEEAKKDENPAAKSDESSDSESKK